MWLERVAPAARHELGAPVWPRTGVSPKSISNGSVTAPGSFASCSSASWSWRGSTGGLRIQASPHSHVEGLTADDFQVFEDGVPQAIELIDFVRVPSGGPDPFEPEPTSQRESDELAADPSNRVFVIYLDLYHTTRASSYQVHQDLIDFVTRRKGRSKCLVGSLIPT